MFESLKANLASAIAPLNGRGLLRNSDIDQVLHALRKALLEADVSLSTIKPIMENLRKKLGENPSSFRNPAKQLTEILQQELTRLLGGHTSRLRLSKVPPTVIMLTGLQGSGKTTFAAKLALLLKNDNQTPLLVACDLQRPNAVDQLKVLGDKAGVPVYAPELGSGVGDPVKVARSAIDKAKRELHSVLIVDTAGRTSVDEEMMQQAIKIRNAIAPDELIFVIDSMFGQEAVNVAKVFKDGVGFSAVALTKLDGDAKGGAALSVASVTGCPILFSSTGESMDAIEVFHPERMASRILDQGDLVTLIEKAKSTFDQKESRNASEKIASNQFTLHDFLDQLQHVRKLGNLKGIMGMLPGVGKMKQQLDEIDEKQIVRTEAIIRSMTPLERSHPKSLNASRRMRIAKGSGTTVTDVNQLMQRFEQAAKVMQSVAQGGPMPGSGFVPPAKKQSKPDKKKGSRSGNPAKRAAENQGLTFTKNQPGSSFGLGN